MRSRRWRLTTVFDLYGSPARLWAMALKAGRLFREQGAHGLVEGVRRKLDRPSLPIDWPATVSGWHLQFENRWPHPDATHCRTHSVTAIILTKGNQRLIEACLSSLGRSIDPLALLEIVVVNNGGGLCLPKSYPFSVRSVSEHGAFNWSAYNNRAVAGAQAEFLLFLNDDVMAVHGGWLDAMLEAALLPGVGVVGAKLLYPDGTIQHCGIELGAGGEVRHRFKFRPRGLSGERSETFEPVDAVTGACLLTPRSLFKGLNGFDVNYPLSYNDVDYCLRATQAGRRILLCKSAELLHLETATRSFRDSTAGERRFQEHWLQSIDRDSRAAEAPKR